MKKEDDRRKKTRVPMSQVIKHSKYQVLGTPVFQENSTIDLSSNGIAFETVQEYQVGTLVLLGVEIDSEPVKLLVCVARVKRLNTSDEVRFAIGAELIAIDPEHKKIMQEHLGKLIRNIQIHKLEKKVKSKVKVKKAPLTKKKKILKKVILVKNKKKKTKKTVRKKK